MSLTPPDMTPTTTTALYFVTVSTGCTCCSPYRRIRATDAAEARANAVAFGDVLSVKLDTHAKAEAIAYMASVKEWGGIAGERGETDAEAWDRLTEDGTNQRTREAMLAKLARFWVATEEELDALTDRAVSEFEDARESRKNPLGWA